MRRSFKTDWKAHAANTRGMTLIEIMVVIVIIGIVSTAIGFGVVGYLNAAKKDAAKAQVNKIAFAVQIYAEREDFPSDLRVLVDEDLVKEKQLKDPWKQDVIYNFPGADREFDVCSAGADKTPGTEDDICHE